MNNLINKIEEHGFRARLVNLKILDELKNEIENQTRNIDKNLFHKYLERFEFKIPENFPNAKSILIVAVPRPYLQTEFSIKGKIITVVIPPTYRGYNSIPEKVYELVKNFNLKSENHFARTKLPEKQLAARSGLAFYGRNNISFIKGLGSYYLLVSFFSDIPADEFEPQEPQMLERCKTCVACINVCPTNAITKDKFLINAERCLTFFNEGKGDFPNWIQPHFHNSLIGCIVCQKFCPENKQVKNWINKKISFDEDETKNILNEDDYSDLTKAVKMKILELDLIDTHIDFKSFKRNLKVLIEKANT